MNDTSDLCLSFGGVKSFNWSVKFAFKKSINTTSDMHHKRQMTTITAYSGGYACARRRLSESKRLLSRNISNFGENLPYSPL